MTPAPGISDEALHLRWKAQNDQQAAEELFYRYFGRITGFAARIVQNRGEAEDVALEAFHKTLEQPPFLENDGALQQGAFRRFLYTVAFHGALRVVRRSNREILWSFDEKPGETGVSFPVPSVDSPETWWNELIDRPAALAALRACMEKLTPKQKTALDLRLDCWPLEEIAALLKNTHQAVQDLLKRALNNLQNCMRLKGILVTVE